AYTLETKSTKKTIAKNILLNSSAKITDESAQSILEKLFSDDLIEEFSFLSRHAHDNLMQQQLSIPIPEKGRLHELWIKRLEVFKGALNAGFEALRKAYFNNST